MSKKSKYIFVAILSLLILGGCKEEMPSLGEASETVSETVTETEGTTAVTAQNETDTSSQTEFSETVSERENISDEQAVLEKLIIEASEIDGEILNPLFGDFDEDGINELVAEYGEPSWSELWFASGDKAYKLEEAYYPKDPPHIKSAGNVYIMVKHYHPAVFGVLTHDCYYYIIKNSSALKVGGETAANLVPNSNYGDFTGSIRTSVEYFDQKNERTVFQTDMDFWYYLFDGEMHQYYGREITREEFLKYDGAAAVLDKIAANKCEATNILKRGNGIININYTEHADVGEGSENIAVMYRNGKILLSEQYISNAGEYDVYENRKNTQTDFERFSEMIYDTAEGDENSFIRERFYGNIGGKNALYAYYGTDEEKSLWYADKDGAKKVVEDITLFIADGDVLMKKDNDYFVMKNGKSKKLDTPDTEDFSMQADGEFTGYVNAGYTDSTRDQEAKKLYWFRYRDGEIAEYTGLDITEEQLLEYGGGRAALDEIAARGGDLVNIVRRDNGIININYALHNQTVTNRFFMTLEIGADGKVTDITPQKEDGTPDNAGWYLHSLKIK